MKLKQNTWEEIIFSGVKTEFNSHCFCPLRRLNNFFLSFPSERMFYTNRFKKLSKNNWIKKIEKIKGTSIGLLKKYSVAKGFVIGSHLQKELLKIRLNLKYWIKKTITQKKSLIDLLPLSDTDKQEHKKHQVLAKVLFLYFLNLVFVSCWTFEKEKKKKRLKKYLAFQRAGTVTIFPPLRSFLSFFQ